jgi:pimeloyl-ACP methyl ester carboxylesterase
MTGNTTPKYDLYGHSAGGQFVESFLLFMPEARYARAVAANPGWYTLPDLEKPYPAGMKNTPTGKAGLARVMTRDVVVLLGEKDIDPNDADLPRNPDAMAEGPYRFARGQFFFKNLQETARQMGVPLLWQLRTVPNAMHSDQQMSAAAADLLFPDAPPAVTAPKQPATPGD